MIAFTFWPQAPVAIVCNGLVSFRVRPTLGVALFEYGDASAEAQWSRKNVIDQFGTVCLACVSFLDKLVFLVPLVIRHVMFGSCFGKVSEDESISSDLWVC
jgi:hypothetical protein